MQENKPYQENEIELVSVFSWLGKGIENVFKGIGIAITSTITFIILFLVFIQKNIFLLIGIVALGAALGWYLDQETQSSYTGEMIAQPNFDSNAQLISKVNYYQSLIEENNTTVLTKELGITSSQAESLTDVSITPFYNNNEMLESYDEFAKKSDSVAISNFDYSEYKSTMRPEDFEFYKITAAGKNPYSIEKILNKLGSIKETNAIESNKIAEQATAEYSLIILQQQMDQVSALIAGYQTAIAASALNPAAPRPEQIFVGNQRPDDTFKNLFDEKARLIVEISKARLEKFKLVNTINIISQRVSKGTTEKKHFIVKSMVIFFGLGLLIALIPLIWKFLKKYDEERVKTA